jgi:hypothetical protein
MSIQRTLCIIPALGSGFHTFVSKVYNDWLKRDVERWWWLAFYVSARCGLLRWLLSVKFRAWLANLFSIMKNIKLIIFMFRLYDINKPWIMSGVTCWFVEMVWDLCYMKRWHHYVWIPISSKEIQ